MFPLTRPFRQVGFSLALIVLTVLPTAFVAAWALRINRPGHIRDVEIELGRQLGLQVTLEGVRYPRPGEVLYDGLVLRHDEPRGKGLVEIARAAKLRLEHVERDLTVHAEKLRLRGESPRQALAIVASYLQRTAEMPFDKINITAPSCEIELGQEALSFAVQDVAGEFVADRVNPTLRLSYRLAEGGSGTRCELALNRDRSSEPVRTALVFKTVEGLPLPARLLNVFFDTNEWLGGGAKLDGSLSLKQVGTGDWEADFRGNLINIDLATLVGQRFPRHRLTGPARVSLKSARWGERPGQGPGWLDVKGELVANNGSIGVDLVNALAREMKFVLAPRVARIDPRKTEVEFRSLGLAFDMRADGDIHLSGALGNEFSADTILVNSTSPLVYAPRGTATVHGLIKTLFPVADSSPGVMVPLTSESRILLCLPTPPGDPTRVPRNSMGN